MRDRVIIHWGNKGQKWGTRKYRNYDGTLTDEGRRRYDYYENKTDRVYNTARAKQMGPKTYVPTGRWGDRKEDLSRFTNEELEALTKRANLERSYREAFNTIQYTKGKKFLTGFKTATREAAEVANSGKAILDSIQGIRESVNRAKDYNDKRIKQATDEANNRARKIIEEANNKAAKDWLLTIENPNVRKDAQSFLSSFAGGKNYSNIDSETLEKIKKLYEKKK